MERGLLIEVEAIDKGGKSTQVDELAKNFALAGEEVVTIHFPYYESPSGQAIRAVLDGYHPMDISANALELQSLFAINRYEQQTRIEDALMRGKVVICDRYIFSGIVYGINAGIDSQWLYDIHHSLVQPDIVIYLDITEEEYKKRCGSYEHLDGFESNLPFIRSAITLYRQFAEMYEWVMLDGQGTVEDIAKMVFHNVQLKIKEMEEE